jgi:hypothetical protein
MNLNKEHIPGLIAASDLLERWRYELPGREAGWCRYLSKKLYSIAKEMSDGKEYIYRYVGKINAG